MAKSPSLVDKHVGARIRMRRLMLGMSQTVLADGLGLTFQQVQKYEKGSNRVGAGRLQQIATILQVPVPFFFDERPGQSKAGSTKPSLADYTAEFMASKDGLALSRAFTSIKDAKLRRSIVAFVETLEGTRR